jgi:hypothetical protein
MALRSSLDAPSFEVDVFYQVGLNVRVQHYTVEVCVGVVGFE